MLDFGVIQEIYVSMFSSQMVFFCVQDIEWFVDYSIQLNFKEGRENNHKNNHFAHVISIICASLGQEDIKSDQGEKLPGEGWQG